MAVKAAVEPASGNVVRVSGCTAAALGAKYADVDVVTAYPIRPYTAIMMTLAQMIANGEHAQLSAALGAGSAGARAFTGSSGVGITFAYELYSFISGARIPIHMAVAD